MIHIDWLTITELEDVEESELESSEVVEDVEELESEEIDDAMKNLNTLIQIQKRLNPSFLYFQTERKQILIIHFIL